MIGQTRKSAVSELHPRSGLEVLSGHFIAHQPRAESLSALGYILAPLRDWT
jgi:hypothetical protein